jgi:hypothetical protein
MINKGFETEITIEQAPNFNATDEKPLKNDSKVTKKVDINVLKARVQEIQNKENKKNITIFILFAVALGALGIYLSA